MRVLSRAREEFLAWAPRKVETNCQRRRGQGCLQQDQCHHPERTSTRFLGKLNYITGKKKTRSAKPIQVKGQGSAIMEHTTQDTVEQLIFSKVHEKEYTLAGEAPICNRSLVQDFGYTANTPASRAVLNRTYVAPADSDSVTKELFTKIAAIHKLIPENSVSITITPEQWTQYWKVVNKETSSLESGLHFGHYKVGSKSDIILHYHAAQETVTLAHAIQLEWWSQGLSVMLDKILGVTLVTKLRAILLMEGDFNATNKIVHGVRMMNNARGHNLMTEEIFSEKNRMADAGHCAQRYSTISPDKRAYQRLLSQSMLQTAMTDQHTQ